MAFEPYLSERNLGCYRGETCPANLFDPECTVSRSRQLERDRWNLLRTDPCQRSSNSKNSNSDMCNILRDAMRPSAAESIHANKGICGTTCGRECNIPKNESTNCFPPFYGKWNSMYTQDFQYPKSHNVVDDCCKSPCPCVDSFPQLPTNIYYACKEFEKCPPIDDCTTYRHYYVPHCVPPRPCKKIQPYDPCECPMEECTITRTDYTRKTPIPNGPATSEIFKHGAWSTNQFCKEFTDETTTGRDYTKKCTQRPPLLKYDDNIQVCEHCPMRDDTTTRVDYRPKIPDDPCYPPWIMNDEYRKPDTNMEKCTTYKHFYKPHCINTKPLQTLKVGSPNAIPFCTTNNLCYTCHDPVVNQKTPVVMYDNDPWPVVRTCPIKYQDNLQVDPCAEMCHATTYKFDYYAKTTCGRRPSCSPIQGYAPSLVCLNDDTTQKASYRAYTEDEYKGAIGNAGNPCGINWGPYKCPPSEDKCLPRFIAPYGNPLKPFIDCPRCPCGPFDDRSSYNHDFKFRSPEIVEEEQEYMCREVNVPKGSSLYRSSYNKYEHGSKAAPMPPPTSKGYRCMNPCSIRDIDTLNRVDYLDFSKKYSPEQLAFYRGRSTTSDQRPQTNLCTDDDVDVETKVVLYPVYPDKKNVCPKPQPERSDICVEDVKLPQPYREIPYSGSDIINRAQSAEVCHGYNTFSNNPPSK